MAESKVILVTGSTDGIGIETALELARRGEKVLLHGRNREKGEAVLSEIKSATGNNQLELYLADFAVLEQVRELAQAIQAQHKHLDVLINNAGVYMKRRVLTVDGYETTFQVNYLAPFLLTNLLLKLLEDSEPARIVTVSSTTHRSASLDFSNLQGERSYDGYQAYAQSKLCDLLFTFELARRLTGTGVIANALHPGAVNTKLLRAGFGGGGISVKQGADTVVYLATSPEVEGVTGEYFVNHRPVSPSPLAYDEQLRQKLWDVSARMVGLEK